MLAGKASGWNLPHTEQHSVSSISIWDTVFCVVFIAVFVFAGHFPLFEFGNGPFPFFFISFAFLSLTVLSFFQFLVFISFNGFILDSSYFFTIYQIWTIFILWKWGRKIRFFVCMILFSPQLSFVFLFSPFPLISFAHSNCLQLLLLHKGGQKLISFS